MRDLATRVNGRRQLGRFAVVFVLAFGVARVAHAAASNGWSPPVAIAPSYTWSSPISVSCASSSFCAAAGGTSSLFAYNGSNWSPITLSGFSDNLDSLSCPVVSFCGGQFVGPPGSEASGAMTLVFGGSWTRQAFDSDGSSDQINAVSCASASFCMAIGEGYWPITGSDTPTEVYSTYNGTQWSAVAPFSGSDQILAQLNRLSCPLSAFCMATDNSHDVFTYNGSGWAPAPGPSGSNFGDGTSDPNQEQGLSCVSNAFCVASQYQGGFTGGGSALFYNGAGWSSARIPNPADYPDVGSFTGVSCPTASFCAGVAGYAAMNQGGAWEDPQSPDSGHPGDALASVSCTSSSFCMAVDDAGYALTYSGASSSPPGSGTSPSPKPKPAEPGAPSRPLRATRITATSITLSWRAPKRGPRPSGYQIEFASGPQNGDFIGSTNGHKRTFTVRHLRPRTRYRFIVYSADAGGMISASLTGPWMRTK